MLCRFYGFALDAVMRMTLRQFRIMLREISVVNNIEMGGDTEEEKPLTGNAGFAVAKTLFKKGSRRR
tara:strand:+ start:999 stop:1199 length:201 start_codon:yes stop_codon:yes gene_type:complete